MVFAFLRNDFDIDNGLGSLFLAESFLEFGLAAFPGFSVAAFGEASLFRGLVITFFSFFFLSFRILFFFIFVAAFEVSQQDSSED